MYRVQPIDARLQVLHLLQPVRRVRAGCARRAAHAQPSASCLPASDSQMPPFLAPPLTRIGAILAPVLAAGTYAIFGPQGGCGFYVSTWNTNGGPFTAKNGNTRLELQLKSDNKCGSPLSTEPNSPAYEATAQLTVRACARRGSPRLGTVWCINCSAEMRAWMPRFPHHSSFCAHVAMQVPGGPHSLDVQLQSFGASCRYSELQAPSLPLRLQHATLWLVLRLSCCAHENPRTCSDPCASTLTAPTTGHAGLMPDDKVVVYLNNVKIAEMTSRPNTQDCVTWGGNVASVQYFGDNPRTLGIGTYDLKVKTEFSEDTVIYAQQTAIFSLTKM